MYISNGKTKTH